MYARGATPERPHVGGMVAPAGRARSRVAGGDAGDVRCVERRRPVDGEPPRRPELGPGNARATITFGVVHFCPPFGKPADS
jgi:hypothetical protein